jgi:hypothetical protein
MSAIISVSPPMPLVKNVLVEEAINPVQYFVFSAHIVKINWEMRLGFARSGVSSVKNILEYLMTKAYYHNICNVFIYTEYYA